MFNIVIDKYSIFFRKKCPQHKTSCVYYSQRVTGEPITLTYLINRGIRSLITVIHSAFFFVNKDGHLILVLLCKTNLECKEICNSEWLKPPISTLLTLLFYVVLSRFGFALQEAILQFKHRQHRRAFSNDLGNFMVFHFYPIGNSVVWGKNGTCSIFTLGVSHFYPNSLGKNRTPLKVIFLISKSH